MAAALVYALCGIIGFVIGNALGEFLLKKFDKPDPVAAQEEYYDLILERGHDEWVPVSEALPEVSGHYLVTISKKKMIARGIPTITNVAIDRYNCGMDRWESYDGSVEAWMVPPKGYRNV